MLKLSQTYEVYGTIFQIDYVCCSPASINQIKAAISQPFVDIPREDSVSSQNMVI